ncbi:MAG: serine hydrolase domain-containing protein, partial [Acidimicrobiales bacterium]
MIPAKMTRRTAPIFALIMMLAACSGADPITTTTVASTATTVFDLDALVTDFVGDSDGGAAVLIVRNGTTTTATTGNADSSGRAINIATPFRVGSISKPFVATMVMQMVDEGRVDIDQPLATYLPNTEIGAGATVRSLLGHTTGIPNYTDQPGFFAEVLSDPARTYTPTEVLSFVADPPAT